MRDHVMVLGSGMMGSGIGAMAALAGKPVVLVDLDESKVEAGLQRAVKCIELRCEHGLNSQDEATEAVNLLSTSINVDKAAEQSYFVVEAIVEDLEIKQDVFHGLDAILPSSVPIASNTSGLQISEIAKLCQHPERTITAHFWLPAHLVPLVEVVMGTETTPETADFVMDELKQWYKEPVLVHHDKPGQLANRIFQAIIREAISIVSSGIATAEDVDKAISYGMAMRFPVWGPLKHLDYIGLPLGLSVQKSVLPSISAEKEVNEFLVNLIAGGCEGVSSGQGFYDWSAREISEDLERRDEFIIETIKILRRMGL